MAAGRSPLTNKYVHYAIIERVCKNMDNTKAWDYAIGIVQLDGIKPSDDFLELVEKEKRGEITGEDIRKVLYRKYKVVGERNKE